MSNARKCDLCGKLITPEQESLKMRVQRMSYFFYGAKWDEMDFHLACWDRLRREMGAFENETD